MKSHPTIDYELRLTETADSTGYFACVPRENIEFSNAVAYLRNHPFDDFMHKHILGFVSTWTPAQLTAALEALSPDDYVIRALVLEAGLLNAKFESIKTRFSQEDIALLANCSPLIYIRHALDPNRRLHQKWIAHLGANIQRLTPLKTPETLNLDMCFAEKEPAGSTLEPVTLQSIFGNSNYTAARFSSDPEAARKTYLRALAKLESVGIVEGDEMRHTASLSPIALLRKWRFSVTVRHRRLHYRLSGTQTAYGRGLHLETARAACAMEMIERSSSFAGIDGDIIPERSLSHTLLYGSRADITGKGHLAVNPLHLGLEVYYHNQKLTWMKARRGIEKEDTAIYVPLQSVFLFANCDEPALYSGLGSTGLASGSTMAQAGLNGMLEVIERDADGTTPYDFNRCFALTSDDPSLAPLLADLQKQGIHIWFQDITPDFGVPCYRCVVQGRDNTISRGTSAHPDGKKAVIAALTETPCGYPAKGPTRKPPGTLPVLNSEDLPCYSTGSISKDYRLLIDLLRANGFDPVFADLTRADLDTPVTRVIIPGMESLADFDEFSRVHPRLFNNYLQAVRGI